MEVVESVPNFSEGRDKNVVDKIVASMTAIDGVRLLDMEMDSNHNRSVVTLVGPPDAVSEGVFRGVETASKLINLDKHTGEHPRFGATDVVPFIPISGVKIKDCVELARALGERIGNELKIPVYLYSDAATKDDRNDLGQIRSKTFQYEQLKEHVKEEKWTPDFGPSEVGTAGATIVGVREPLIAYNVNLRTTDLAAGKKIAKALRAKTGGLTFVKALAFFLEDKQMVQISMNLTSYSKTPIYRAFELVKLEAARYGFAVAESEVVGLTPLDALVETARYYLQLNDFKSDQILERRMMESNGSE